jgi:hypothetical protein
MSRYIAKAKWVYLYVCYASIRSVFKQEDACIHSKNPCFSHIRPITFPCLLAILFYVTGKMHLRSTNLREGVI